MLRFIGLFFFLFFILDLVSIIALGMNTGAFNALGCVFLSIIIGILLLKYSFARINRMQNMNVIIAQDVAPYHMVLMLSSILFIMPGFLSDALAVLLTLKPLHRVLGFILKPLVVLMLKKQLKENYSFFAQNVKSEFGHGANPFGGASPFSENNMHRQKGNVYEADFSVEDEVTDRACIDVKDDNRESEIKGTKP